MRKWGQEAGQPKAGQCGDEDDKVRGAVAAVAQSLFTAVELAAVDPFIQKLNCCVLSLVNSELFA